MNYTEYLSVLTFRPIISTVTFAETNGVQAAEASPIKLLIIIDYPDHAHHKKYAMMTKTLIHAEAAANRRDLFVEILLTKETWPDLMGSYSYLPVIKE